MYEEYEYCLVYSDRCREFIEKHKENLNLAVTDDRANELGGGPESPGPVPVTDTDNSGKRPDFIPNRVWLTNGAETAEQTDFHIGEAFTMKLQSKNVGDANSPSGIEIAFYHSKGKKVDDNPDKVGTDEIKKDKLKIGKTHTETEGLTAPKYPGEYNITGCVDTGKKVTEKKENNNCSAEVVYTVWSNPNLTVANIVLSGGKARLAPNEVFNVDATIANPGENFGRTVMIAYFLNDVLIGNDRIKRENLLGGESKVETLESATAPTTPGSYTLKVCVDYDNRVAETDESDNCTALTIAVKGRNRGMSLPTLIEILSD